MVRAVPGLRRDPLAVLTSMVTRWGPTLAFPTPRTPVLLTTTPQGARDVLVADAGAWSKHTPQYGALSAVTGSGLLTSSGDAWRTRRRLVQPAFAHGRLPVVADESVAAGARLASLAPATGERVVDVDAALLQATLEVVGRTLFGADVTDDGERLVHAVLGALEEVVARVRTPLPAWLPTLGRARLRRAVAALDASSSALVAERRARPGESADDLLGLLLAAADAGAIDPEGVRDELVTTVIAGHETVAASLTWTLGLLARHPAALAVVHAELDAVLGERDPGWEDLRSLVRTRAVVDEALRLYPPAWALSRRAAREAVVDGVAVPSGTIVIVSPWLVHRRPEAFADPDRFDPGRFDGPARDPAYLPFGTGARMCIGRDLALVESVLLLARWLRDVDVAPVRPGEPMPEPDALVTVRPRGGMPLRLRRR